MFHRDRPRDTWSVQEEWTEGCVLLSRWLPEEIKHCASVGLIDGLDQIYGTVDFTYSSVKVRLKQSKSYCKCCIKGTVLVNWRPLVEIFQPVIK